jgi:replicative DNA helicase
MTMNDWPEPVPFEADPRGELPPFPVEALPPALSRYAASISACFLAPPDLPAVLTLGAVSGSIAGRVRLRVGPDWFEPANLYLLAVAPPSLHKSPIIKLATEPIEREEAQLIDRWRVEEADRAAKREVVAHHIAAIKRKAATPTTDELLRQKLAEREELSPRARPRLMIEDSTSEHIVQALEAGPLFIASAEGRTFELMSGLYRNSGEDGADVFLKAWSEDPIRSGRKTSGDVYVPHPNLALCLAVQPTVVDKLARREDFRGRGLIARFLCAFPRTRVGFRQWSEASDLDAAARLNYGHLLTALLGMTRATNGAPSPIVTLTTDAARAFGLYRQELEDEQRHGRLLAEWQDLGGKAAGHCARLALVAHMAEHGAAGAERQMSGPTMEAGIALCRYFVAHTIATWDGCAVEPIGARMVRWLAREPRTGTTTQKLHRAHQRLFPKAHMARAMAIELAERGYLRATEQADTWEVSPRLYPDARARGESGDGRGKTAKQNAKPVTDDAVRGGDDGDGITACHQASPESAVIDAPSENPTGRHRNGAASPLSPDPGAANCTSRRTA